MKIAVRSQMRCGLLVLSIVLLSSVARAATVTVQVGPVEDTMSFSPDPVFIQPGDTVEWVWASDFHSVTSGEDGTPNGMFDSDIQSVPFTFSFTFPTAGSFPYFCLIHEPMMTGTVVVSVSTPTPTPTPVPPTPTPTPIPTATPTPTSTPPATPTSPPFRIISGNVTGCTNAAPVAVVGATMSLTGPSPAPSSTPTDGSGNYTLFVGIGQSYTVTPTKAAHVPGSAGISTVDVIAAQRHFLVIGTPLSGCRLAAADVNGASGINTVDVIAIQRFFLGLSTGIANTGKYQFTPASISYGPVFFDQTGQNYSAILFGDIATPFVPRPGDPSPDATGNDLLGYSEVDSTVAAVALPEVATDRGNFIAAVTATAIDGKNRLVGFQGDFTFDERAVTFQSEPVQKAGITGGNWNVSGNVLPGKGPIRTLRVSAFSNDFTPLLGSGTLFELRMAPVSKAAERTQLLWAAPPDQFIFIDADLNTQEPGNAAPGNAASGGVTTSRMRK